MDFFHLLNYSWNVNNRTMAYCQFYLGVVLAACGWLVQMKTRISLIPALVITAIIALYFSTTYLTIRSFYYRNHEINEEIKGQVDAQNFKNNSLAKMLKFNHALRNWRGFRLQMLIVDIFIILLIWYRSESVNRLISRFKGNRHQLLIYNKSKRRLNDRHAHRIYPLSYKKAQLKKLHTDIRKVRCVSRTKDRSIQNH